MLESHLAKSLRSLVESMPRRLEDQYQDEGEPHKAPLEKQCTEWTLFRDNICLNKEIVQLKYTSSLILSGAHCTLNIFILNTLYRIKYTNAESAPVTVLNVQVFPLII